jgi:hypothetical protein
MRLKSKAMQSDQRERRMETLEEVSVTKGSG